MSTPPNPQHNNPLHGVTLAHIVTTLVEYYGWQGLAARIPVNCFSHDPSIKSSLTFLRRTPWARDKVEALYLEMLSEQRQNEQIVAVSQDFNHTKP